ncbi:short-chain dehydrogenase [Flavobacterium akiainvivens]|uniref:Short-chain dehydrogenase n=1 Tax=Flavobacterium akiainvivens TaxID=1202724 RepID=A0A0M9VJT1_9FLAO|nr:SDR family NAD(P)-dependent oxidoreductase [Flavobacterium akiainvivens]KOS08070.1 short-chain dehydrogenase [Flavobacterium akiainvivens]SFQ71532.1 Short-chain dehydrogenase [Flavobacterium akiainvivens]
MSNKKLALITGASNGIGFELAKLFAKDDYDLLLVSRGQEKLEAAKKELAIFNVSITTFAADLSKYDDIIRLKAWVEQQGYIINALVLNAGQGYGGDFLQKTELARELELIRLNVDSYVHLSKLFIKDLVRRNEGSVLMTSSVSGTAPIPYEAVYGASKAFVNSFFYALRNEIKTTNIKMTLLMPGATETNFFKNADMAETKVGSMKKDDPAEVAYRGYYALMSGHEYAYGSDEVEYEGDVLNRIQSESQKAQRHRLISHPDSTLNK